MSDQGPIVFGGRYELHRRLARGGMAEVFVARDQLLDRPVAVKVLAPQYAGDPAFVERFRREAQSAANLTHPNIVGVYDWGEESGTYYIVMEYVAGRSLADVLRQEGTLLPERAADIGIDIAAALGFAHRNGVVHRDVKPGNVLLSSDGQVKVTDFGIARAIAAIDDNLTQTGLVMGTATYFSPEQAQGKPVDPRSDVYSLGVVLYETVVGRPPFKGDDALAVAYQHVQDAPPPPRTLNSSIEPALEAIILKALAKNPSNRYPSAEDLRADLRRYRKGHQISGAAGGAGAAAASAAAAAAYEATQAAPAATGPVAEATQAVPASSGGYSEPAYTDGYRYEEEPRRNSVFIAVLFLLLAVLGVGLYLLADTLGIIGDDDSEVAAGDAVEVPEVVGLPGDEAETRLTALGFVVQREFASDANVAEGNVISQDPGGLTEAERGSEVTLTISSGAELVAVPNVVGRLEDDAVQILQAAGFESIERQPVADPDAEIGEVVGQDPDAEVEAPITTTITIRVSQGPDQIVVQNVEGQTAEQAERILEQQGFTVARKEENSGSVPEGVVIRTTPAAGTVQDEGTTVTIVVSAGVEQVTVPNVVEKTEETARDELRTAGFAVEVIERDLAPGDPDDGRVLAQDPDGGTRADKGSTVTITVGRAELLPSSSTSSSTTTTTTTTTPGDGFDTGD